MNKERRHKEDTKQKEIKKDEQYRKNEITKYRNTK